MKYLKFLIIALVAFFSFATANAQVVLRARVGARPHRGYYWNHRWYHHREFRHHHWRYY